jgi:hypothetical protein
MVTQGAGARLWRVRTRFEEPTVIAAALTYPLPFDVML